MKEIIDKLREVFTQDDAEVKLQFLAEIQDLPDATLIDSLVGYVVSEPDRSVKTRILLILERLLPLGDGKVLELLLRSSDSFVCNGAIDLIKRVNIDWYPLLEKLSFDEEKKIRKFVVDALVGDDSSKARHILRERILDENTNIVYSAIEQLGSVQDKESAQIIEKTLFDSHHPMVICSALEALAKIGVCLEKDRILFHFSRQMDSMYIFPLLKFLGRFGDIQNFDFLEKLVDQHWGTYAKEIIDALDAIIKNRNLTTLPESLTQKLDLLSKDHVNNINQYAITKLLSGLEQNHSLARARDMLCDHNMMIQICGIEILAERGDEEDIGRLEALVEGINNNELLEAIGDAVYKIDKRLSEEK